MADDPLFLAGVGIFLVGIAKGGAEIFGVKAGPLGLGAAAIFVLVGLGLGFLAWDSNRFRVTDVHLRSVNTYVGPCPGDQVFEGLITTKGGDGEVTYRLFSEGGYRSPLQSKAVEKDGSFGFEVRVRVSSPGQDVMRARVNSPSSKDSDPVPFTITCTGRSG